MSFWRDFSEGVRKQLPITVTAIPFGLILGASIHFWQLEPLSSLSTCFIIFAGASQFLALQMFYENTPASSIIIAAIATNLRHAFYSLNLKSFFSTLSLKQKVMATYLMTDECFASVNPMRNAGTLNYAKFMGSGFTLWFFWQISCVVGYFLGNFLPPQLSLEKSIDFLFLAIVTMMVSERPLLAATITSAIASAATVTLPNRFNILIGIGTGLLTYLVLMRKSRHV